MFIRFHPVLQKIFLPTCKGLCNRWQNLLEYWMKTDKINLFERWFYMGEIYLRKPSVFNLKFTLYFQISFGVHNR
jgi:hypothetical protein